MDKFVKIAVVVGVLLAGIGVFYRYVIFLPGLERDKIEREENTKRELAKQEAIKQVAYDSCKAIARANYSLNWADACKDVALVKNRMLNECLSDSGIVNNPYMGKNFCTSRHGNADLSSNCSLPKARGESINQEYHNAQQRCINEAKSGL